MDNKLEKLHNECLRIKGQCGTYAYDNTMFIGDVGILAEYILHLEIK